MDEEEGLSIAVSPVQLAAILEGEDISESDTASNRFWGGLGVVFGVVELIGAGGLLLTPEPTMVTKAGGAVLGAHGLDTVQANARQVWTGHEEHTLTNDGAAAIARALGADEATAGKIGTGVDMAVPIAVSLGVGAARILAIRGGRISLAAHEAAAGSRLGGHTILEHVGKTEAELRARLPRLLRRNPRLQAVSTFKTLDAAEKVLYSALRARKKEILAWAKTATPGARQAFQFYGKTIIGEGIEVSSGLLKDMKGVRFVLKMETYGTKPYYILTAFPIL